MNRHWKFAIGALLVIIGALWTLQGLGFVGGSAMTGVTLWAVLGPIVAVVGLFFMLRAQHPPD